MTIKELLEKLAKRGGENLENNIEKYKIEIFNIN